MFNYQLAIINKMFNFQWSISNEKDGKEFYWLLAIDY